MNPGESLDPQGATGAPAAAVLHPAATEARELWRVVSVDGSTRIFQTKPALEARGKRPPTRRVTPCPLDRDAASRSALFERRVSTLPPVVTDGEAATVGAGDAELSTELTSVTQAWPSLSPGIRGAVMALIRAATMTRPPRPAAAPRRE